MSAEPATQRPTPSLPPPLQSLLDQALVTFQRAIEEDGRAEIFPNLLDTERDVQSLTRELGRRLLQAYADTRLQQAKAPPRACPGCGQPMEWLLASEWPRGTPFGDVKMGDCYAYCRSCHESARPLHGLLGTARERWSLAVEEMVVDFAVDESCEHAVQKLARHHPGVEMDRSVALRILLRHGLGAREFVADKLAEALKLAGQEGQRPGVAELEVEYDGGMVPVATLEPISVPEGEAPEFTPVRHLPKRHKNCRWEEAKLGLVQVPGEVEGRLYAARPTAELDEVFQDLLALACLKGWSEQTEVRGLADGARYIRPRLAEAFHACAFRFILDRPHAKEHLGDAGEELEKLGGSPKDGWVRGALDRLEAGAALEVVAELRQAATRSTTPEASREILRREADYFERNQDAVAYKTYRERGWSTASSEVESGHRSVVQVRLKLAGTWWHPDNIKYVLALRLLRVNGWWSEYWTQQRQRWRDRAQYLRNKEPRTKIAVA